MIEPPYQPDPMTDPMDALIMAGAGPEPPYDPVMEAFLRECHNDLRQRCDQGGLLEFASFGERVPWLYRLTFRTRGLMSDTDGEVLTVNRHVIALRFLPDYLRYANRFSMLRLIDPGRGAFHPNIDPAGAICVEVYPGESLVEICQALHDLIRWRLRQYDERDALNPLACAWGRENIDQPIDTRPLFGQPLKLQWNTTTNEK